MGIKDKIKETVEGFKAPQFYTLDEILEKNALYNVVYGGRSIGKSYSIKQHCLKQAWEEDREFGLINRHDDKKVIDIKNYFGDMQLAKITDGGADGINVRSGEIYFTLRGKKVKTAGWVFVLAQEEQYKSMVYANIYNILFEEFISRKGYLCGEMEMLDSLISTIFRLREGCKVWLIGNTISRVFPYVNSWGLYKLEQQKEGTIDTYRREVYNQFSNRIEYIDIAVERAKNRVGSARSLSGKGQGVEKGEWEVPDVLTANKDFIDKTERMYEFVVAYAGFFFLCSLHRDNKYNYFVYIERKTSKIMEGTRTIGDIQVISNLHTKDFTPVVPRETFIFSLIDQEKIYYCDNITAADFQNSIRSFK